MRKNFGVLTCLYPMPVLIVTTYNENNSANVMNAAWGGIYDENQVMLCLSKEHKTYQNIVKRQAFTISIGDAAHVMAEDYVGIVSGNDVPDKCEKAGFHVLASEFVDAPIIDELPMALECKLLKINEDGIVIGEIINVNADESILNEKGKIDPEKFNPIAFDPIHSAYRQLGTIVGKAFHDGLALKNKS